VRKEYYDKLREDRPIVRMTDNQGHPLDYYAKVIAVTKVSTQLVANNRLMMCLKASEMINELEEALSDESPAFVPEVEEDINGKTD